MPRQYNIRWREIDNETLRREVRNFNRRIQYYVDKGVDKNILPNKRTVREIKSRIRTRNDYNFELNILRDLNANTAQNFESNSRGLTVTVFERKEIQKRFDRINSYNQRELKRIENQMVKSRGESLGYTVKQSDVKLLDFRKRTLNFKAKTQADWERLVERVTKQSNDQYQIRKKELYKENYLRALNRVFAGLNGSDELLNMLEQLPSDLFDDVRLTDLEGSIDFIYDEIELQDKFEYIQSVWEGFLSE